MRVRAPELGDHYVDSVKGLARTAYGAAGSVRVKRPGWLSGKLTGAMQGSLGRWERLGAGGPDPCWSSRIHKIGRAHV